MPANVEIRCARCTDLPAIQAMFAIDDIGGHGDTGETADLPLYQAAFDRIAANPDTCLYVATINDDVVGTFQTILVTSLTGKGASSLMVKAVHTRADLRGRGIGEAMIRFAIEAGRVRDVRLIELMSNAGRTDAHRFYRRMGFVPSHVGFKIKMPGT